MAGSRGLYEALLTEALAAELDGVPLSRELHELRAAEAPDRLAHHLGGVLRRALADLGDDDRVTRGVALARKLIDEIGAALDDDELRGDRPTSQVLTALLGRRPDGQTETLARPLLPLLDTVLLTNAPGEPRVGSQIHAEIPSADRIDVVMAFIRQSGIVPFLDALRVHCGAGRGLRVLTTTYTGSTEGRALDRLRDLGAEVKVSYELGSTRLHAKAWLFHRRSGASTAYVGSSNLTHTAQVDGLEWNVRVSGQRNPDVIGKVEAVFDAYWNGGDFEAYDALTFARRTATTPRAEIVLSPIELRLEPFQERLLEQIAVAREQGHHKNLLVSATGTGKTVMAAVDYTRLAGRKRLLFVAHREEILAQTLATFRHALRDHAFGELWVGGRRPETFEHVFASIQSLTAAGLADLAPDHFDVVIVDEFHHAAAPSYTALLEHVRPRELLGLTATPERSDGLPLLHWFDDRIAAELRLWDAIDQHRLTPFAYYGIHDGLDLREVPWKRGRGYDVEALEKVYTGNDAWARGVVRELGEHTASGRRALGFCVSVEHARFMARVFTDSGVPARAVWADTPADERRAALVELARGAIQVVFSVDLFNEGVDVPAVDTLLLLRPTDSPVLFLQQLGRGLRRAHGKSQCTVLDFVGIHRQEFRFDRRLRALLPGSRKQLEEQIERGFPFLPAGCHMQLDRECSRRILANLRQSVPSNWRAKVDELRSQGEVSLARYLDESFLDLDDVYAGGRSWSDLRAAAGQRLEPAGPHEATLRRACGRLLHLDDPLRLERYRQWLAAPSPPEPEALDERDRRLLRMLVAQLGDQVLEKHQSLAEACQLVWAHAQVRRELVELFDVLATRVDHLQPALAAAEVPLRVHARYSRLEILAGFGVGRSAPVAAWQTGVYFAREARTDLLAVTLDKTSGQFSPTTRYRDYAISRELIHWETQSKVRAESETGRRYREHVRRGTTIQLFARLRADDRAFWCLGPATYVGHEGERPMAITWKLEHPLAGDLYASFAAAVA